MRWLVVVALVAVFARADQLHPAQVPLQFPAAADAPAKQTARKSVAIIGAGAGGSSTAFWIGRARERFGLNVEVDVYERGGYVGGREYLNTHMPSIDVSD
jgi:hypothetical protein